MKSRVYIVKSSSWMPSENIKLSDIQQYLDEAIDEFIPEDHEIINIETKTERLHNQFWIYVKAVNQTSTPVVSISLERAKKYARHQHAKGLRNEDLVEFEDWASKD